MDPTRLNPTAHIAPIGAPAIAPADGPVQRRGIFRRTAPATESTQRFGMAKMKILARQVKNTIIPQALRRHRPETVAMPMRTPARAHDLSMRVENGKVALGDDAREQSQTEQLLESVLNKGETRYQDQPLKPRPDSEGFLLHDTQNRLVHAHATELAVSVFKSSENRVGMNPAPPGDALRAQITGVHTDTAGQSFRIHEKKLHVLNGNTWVPHAFTDDLKSLHNLGGALYAVDNEGKARALDAPDTPLALKHRVQSLALSSGNLVALTEDDDKGLHLERPNGLGAGFDAIHALVGDSGILTTDHPDKPVSIAGHQDQLIVSTASGKLHRIDLPQNLIDAFASGDEETQELEPLPLGAPLSSDALKNALGPHTYGELFSDNGSQLFARIKDKHGNEHSATWHAPDNSFKPGWNLSQALVLDRQRGLTPLMSEADQQIQLPRGRIARHGDDLLTQDERTGEWKKSSEKDIKELVAGRDGFAYLIDKDGKLKQLKVAPQATVHDLGKGVDLALPGRGTEAKGTILRGAEHLTVEKVAIQNDQRYMTLSGGDLRLHDQFGERAKLPAPPGDGDIAGIASHGKAWFALKNGVLHKLEGAGADPKSASIRREWQIADLPNGATATGLHTDNEGRLVLKASVPDEAADGEDARIDRDFVRDNTGNWTVATPTAAAAAGAAHEHFKNLTDNEPGFTRRGNIKTSFNVLGRNNVETAKVRNYAPNKPTQNYVTSHLASTGAFKVPADSLQHAWKGREGLRPLYQQEVQTLQQLSADAAARPAPIPSSMEARLDALKQQDPSPHAAELSELFQWFHQTVAEDMQKTLRELAENQGALLKNGAVNLEYKAGKPPKTDLLGEVSQVLENTGASDKDSLGAMIKSLQDKGFTLAHRNPMTALDDSRKRGDTQALLSARLAANARVMKEMSAILDLMIDARDSERARLDPIAKRLAGLHNEVYEGNPIKRYTDAGFRSYAALEASYDATKSLLKYVRKENHPLKRNALESLQSTNNVELKQNLAKALRDLEPRESLKINRNYGGGITGGITGPAGEAFVGFRGAIDPDRTYGMSFTRFDRGLKVSMNREGTISSTVSLGFGGGLSDTKTTAGDSHQNHQTNGGWFGGSLDAKHKYSDNTALSFFIRDDELESFMDDLLIKPLHHSKRSGDGGLKPMELMNRGVEQEVRTSGKHNFDLEFNANLESRTNYGQTDAEPVAGFMRFGVGLLANLALLNAERERTQGRGNDGLKTDIYSSNRARLLEKGSVAGYGRMFSTIFTSRPDNLFIAGGAPIGVMASLSFDNKTGKTYDVRFKDALPVQASDMKSLESSLKSAFPELEQDPVDDKTINERLAALHTRYATKPPENDAQHAALTTLFQTRRQQLAADQGSGLMSMMDMVVKHNNVNRIGQSAPTKRGIDVVKEMLGKDVNPSNAERIHELMNADPQLKSLLDELKSSSGTTRAEIRLEVNDPVKQEIEDGALNGTLTDAGLKNQLSKRDNLRIKAIAVFRTAAKEDSLGVPLPYVSFKSGSSLSIERLLGEVTFDYGLDQVNPKTFTLDGELADAAAQHNAKQAARDLSSDQSGVFRAR